MADSTVANWVGRTAASKVANWGDSMVDWKAVWKAD
jgi:hypothetical protein